MDGEKQGGEAEIVIVGPSCVSICVSISRR